MQKKHPGFTLIEMSIVLVIIGLIIGGILVGQELILQSQIRKDVKQIEEINNAAMTFRLKYNALPGDIPNASTFGLGTIATTWPYNSTGNGNGNGLIETNWVRNRAGEIFNFWLHLSNAKLFGEMECTAVSTVATDYCYDGNFTGFGRFTPKINSPHTKYQTGGPATFVPLAGVGLVGLTEYTISGTGSKISNHGYYFAASPESPGSGPLRPSIARTIDLKIDDGYPLSGKVTTHRIHTTYDTAADASCVDTTATPNIYKSSDTGTNYCKLMVATPF